MRGKKAAQSANRRVGQVLNRAEVAEAALTSERQQWRARETELETELKALRFEVSQRIEQAAVDRVAEVAADAAAQVTAIRVGHSQTANKVLRMLQDEVSPTVLLAVADTLEVSTEEIDREEYLRRHPGTSRSERRNLAGISDQQKRTIAKECDRDAARRRPSAPPMSYPWGIPGVRPVL